MMIKARLKRLRFATFGILVLLLALLPVSAVSANGLGHGFYGTVKVDGGDADVGTVISAQVGGTEYGNCTVTTPGQYALIVQGEIADGATIHFYIGVQEADKTFPFHDGWTTELNLTFGGPPPPEYTITFDTDPEATGSITFDGVSYSDGDTVDKAADTYSIVADPGSGYTFDSWETTGDLSVTAPSSDTTTCDVSGVGTLRMVQTTAPPPPPAVGGTAYPENTLGILAPWIAIAVAIIAGVALLIRRRRAQS